MNPFIDGLKEHSREAVKEIVLGALSGLKDVAVDLSYSIALVGGGLSIILYVVGFGKRETMDQSISCWLHAN